MKRKFKNTMLKDNLNKKPSGNIKNSPEFWVIMVVLYVVLVGIAMAVWTFISDAIEYYNLDINIETANILFWGLVSGFMYILVKITIKNKQR